MRKAKVNNGCVNALTQHTSIELLHKRLGHICEKGLKILDKKDILAGLKGANMSLKLCMSCLTGKQHRASLCYKALHRRPNVLDLMHSDVWGPITTSTHG